MRSRRAVAVAAAVACSASLLVACFDGGVGPRSEWFVLQVAGGDVQFAPSGELLTEPLRLSVRREPGDQPATGVTVRWAVLEGAGAELEHETSATIGETGIATNRLRLGSTLGRYVVRASVEGATNTVEFEAHAVGTPSLDAVAPAVAEPTDVVTLTGSDFSAVATHNTVLFDEIRGRVVSATTTRLEVEVPPCLPDRPVAVRVRLGELASGSRPLDVMLPHPPPAFEVGAVQDVDPGTTPSCVFLPPGNYLAVSLSAGTVGGGLYGFGLRGLAPAPLTTEAARSVAAGPAAARRAGARVPGGARDAASAWESRLRETEARLVEDARGGPGGPVALRAPRAVPSVGDRRSFEVFGEDGRFEQVEAVARWVGEHAVMYVDLDAPGGGLGEGDLDDLSALFDEVIHPAVTGAFGSPSDLDGNDRIAILFTPVVNALTPPGSDGFVGGFFFGLDLMPGQNHSNGGEIFYALVPDPEGRFGPVVPAFQVVRSLPAVVAHELQHMVHFNQRVLVGGATTSEALWLSEGLAHMAEDVAAQRMATLGLPTTRFEQSNDVRARRFLVSTSDVSLLIVQGQGSLEERGAAWLFVRYLDEQVGRDALLRLTRSSRRGVENVTEVAGRPWETLMADWLSALDLDAFLASGPLQYPDLDLRHRLSEMGEPYPLRPPVVGPGDLTVDGSLYSSSGHHVRLIAGGEGLALQLAAPTGAAPPVPARFRLRIVRTN